MTEAQKRTARATPILDACPRCGGHLEFTDAVVSEEWAEANHNAAHPIQRRERDVLVVACCECEFVVESLKEG